MLVKIAGYGPRLVRSLLQNTTLRASAAFSVAGLAFALGTLLLARAMPVADFGRVALEISILNLFGVVGPLGLDQVLLRQGAEANSRVLGRALIANGAVAIAAAAGARFFYALPALEVSLVALAIAATGAANVASAGMRAQGREAVPLAMVAGANLLLLAAGVYAVFVSAITAPWILTTVAIGAVLIAVAAWSVFVLGDPSRAAPAAVRWSEALSLLGLVAVGALAVQLERFIIPKALGHEALAVFSVLASVAIFPFRLVTSGAGFALTPRLRRAKTLAERQAFVVREVRTITILLAIATAIIVICAPVITAWLTGGRYHLSYVLVLAACASGAVKVVQSILRAVVIGCGSSRAILAFNVIAWLAIAAAAAAGVFAARWGLAGLVLGAALGALATNVPAVALAARSMRTMR